MLKNRTTATVAADSPFEAGWRAGVSGGLPIFGAKSRSSAAEFHRGFEGGRQERRNIATAQAHQARAAAADSWIHGALAGRRDGPGLVGVLDPQNARASAAGYQSMRSGRVLRD